VTAFKQAIGSLHQPWVLVAKDPAHTMPHQLFHSSRYLPSARVAVLDSELGRLDGPFGPSRSASLTGGDSGVRIGVQRRFKSMLKELRS